MRLLFIIILSIFSFNLFPQGDSLNFYDLNLSANSVYCWYGGGDRPKFKSLDLPETYFFFTKIGIYGADENGILKYQFSEIISTSREFEFDRVEISGTDLDLNKDCRIVIHNFHKKDSADLFIIYNDREFIFKCKKIE